MLKLYHCAETRSMRSLWLLNELRVPFTLVDMPFDLSITRAPDYLAVHPLGRVPCLVDDDFRLFESGAICEYLCERYPECGLGRLLGDPERYQWLQWIHYSETIAVHAAALVQQILFIKPKDRSSVIRKLEGRRLLKSIELIEREISHRPYMLSSGFSAADVCVGYSLHLAIRFLPLEQIPHAVDYYRRLSSRPAFVAALPKGWTRPLMYVPEAME